MAEDCLLASPIEGPLWRKLPLKSYTPAAEFDPTRKFGNYIDRLLGILLICVKLTMN